MGIEMGIGASAQADVFVAGQEAASQVVAHLAGRRPDFVLVFSSIRFADPRLLKGIRGVTGLCPLIGCTDAGGIFVSGARRRAVTVIGFLGNDIRFHAGVARHLSANPEGAGQTLATELKARAGKDNRLLMAFPDGLAANLSALTRGLTAGAGALPLVGAAAADDFFFQKTFQYFNDEILTDSVPAVMLSGDVKFGIGVRHGWMPLGRPRRVTRSQGHIIYQLDRQPAVSIYEDYLGLKKDELLEGPLAQLAISYPLGTAVRGQSEFLLRDAIRVGRAGSLICTGEIQEGSEVRLMIGAYESALEAAQQAAHDAVEQVGRNRLRGALVFSSVARQKMLGSEYHGEIDVIRNALGGSGVRMGGFYSYGELAPYPKRRRTKTGWENVFHNESVVVVTLG